MYVNIMKFIIYHLNQHCSNMIFIKLSKTIIFFISLVSMFVGCAPKSKTIELTQADELLLAMPIEVDIFSVRGFLGGSDYERYHLKDHVLWRECGQLLPGRSVTRSRSSIAGDDVFLKDPNLSIEQRRIEEVNYSESLALRELATRLYKSLENQSHIPRPGSVISISGPGLFELSIKLGDDTRKVITSVDAVAEEETKLLEATHQLFATFRSVGPVICNSSTFFGIPRIKIASEKQKLIS
jgi:hypothetical protein